MIAKRWLIHCRFRRNLGVLNGIVRFMTNLL
jgi:hypothetical protein